LHLHSVRTELLVSRSPTGTDDDDLLGDLYEPNCPARDILDRVMSRWGALALIVLRERRYRFSELRWRIGGVSEKMLVQTLRALEEDGFVVRHDSAQRERVPVCAPVSSRSSRFEGYGKSSASVRGTAAVVRRGHVVETCRAEQKHATSNEM